MNREDFEAALRRERPPAGGPPALLGLWHAERGDWDGAHRAVQDFEADPDCCWVHAYLHRWEGDASNAAYWYRRAGKPACRDELQEEWREIVEALTE